MKKKLLNCLLPLACLATVSVSCGSSAQAAVLGDDYPPLGNMGASVLIHGPCTGVNVRPSQPIVSVTPMVSLCL